MFLMFKRNLEIGLTMLARMGRVTDMTKTYTLKTPTATFEIVTYEHNETWRAGVTMTTKQIQGSACVSEFDAIDNALDCLRRIADDASVYEVMQ